MPHGSANGGPGSRWYWRWLTRDLLETAIILTVFGAVLYAVLEFFFPVQR